jgi:hypothetical protein
MNKHSYYLKATFGNDLKDSSFICDSPFDLTRILDTIGFGQVFQNGSHKFIIQKNLMITCFDRATNKKIASKTLTNEKYFKQHSDIKLSLSLDRLCERDRERI